jgi:Holliday junction resolvase
MARDKGARGERELAKILNENGIECHRGYVQFRQSDLVGIEGIHPEVKRVEKLNIHEAMRQATEEAEKRQDGRPTVFHRKNGSKWLVTMFLDDWIKLFKEARS